MILPNL